MRLTRPARVVLAAVAALVLMSSPSAEANDFKVTCVITGEARFTDKTNPALGMRLVGGKGFYYFYSLWVPCVGTAKGTPVTVYLIIDSQGDYEMPLCGTGKMQSDTLNVTAASDGQAAKYHALLSDEKYSVEFVGTAGEFWWHDSDKDTPDLKANPLALDPDKDGHTDEKDYDFGGYVQLSESLSKGSSPGPNDPEGNCGKAFAVDMVISIDEA